MGHSRITAVAKNVIYNEAAPTQQQAKVEEKTTEISFN